MPRTRTDRGRTAAETLAGKRAKATSLASAALRQWSERLKQHSLFSARTTSARYLDMVKRRLMEVAARVTTPQEAERRLRETLKDLGYRPETGFPDARGRVPPATRGSIRDLSSSRRIQLILDTNVKQARSLGQVAASENPLTLMSLPAWKLTRTGARKKPRGNWPKRWAEAGAACGWQGASRRQMVALKTSPIWQKLADGAGGFRDTLGSPYPPFAFGSGMAWVNVGRKEWQRMCAAEGIPDGLGEVAEKAKELASGGGTVSGDVEKVEIPRPALPSFASAIEPPKDENVLVLPDIRPDTMAAAAVSGAGAAFEPDWTMRDEANDAVDDALDEVRRYIKAIGDAAKAVDKAGGGGRRYAQRIAAIMAEAKSLEGRIVNYGGALEEVPAPTDEASQGSFDSTMRRYASSAADAARKVGDMAAMADLYRKAAERSAEGGI